jgi:hypothetical protein
MSRIGSQEDGQEQAVKSREAALEEGRKALP